MFQMRPEQIGGAIVRRCFSSNGKFLKAGMKLTANEVLKFPSLNRMALIDKRYIDVYPKNGEVSEPGERFVISAGFGRFFVIEGKKLNDEALDREQAYALAGVAPPSKQPRRKKQAVEA